MVYGLNYIFREYGVENFTPGAAILGGIVLGLAAALFMLLTGRICGVSGIYSGLLSFKRDDSLWRLMFVAGLIVGGGLILWLLPQAGNVEMNMPVGTIILAGLLVGFGVRLGSGCTSGHGICGMGRLSPRSFVASGIFLVAGIVMASFLSPYLV